MQLHIVNALAYYPLLCTTAFTASGKHTLPQATCPQVRLTLLPQLLEEAYAHLHSCLCASTLGRKLFVQPFHRDVQLTTGTVAVMTSALTHCKQVIQCQPMSQ